MKRWKTLTALVLCLALLLPTVVNAGSISFEDLINAANKIKCGEDLTWSLDKNGTLTISGTGPMTEFTSASKVPWHLKSALVKTVVIEKGVTTVGAYAFSSCGNLTDVYYEGTRAQWNAISIGSNNDPLLAAALHCADAQPYDLDADGKLTTDDAVYLLLFVMFGAEDYPVPDGMDLDLNNDSKADTDDAVYLLLHVMFGAEDYPI